MCESEEGWHPVQSFFQFYNDFSDIHFAYFSRIMNIMKYGNLRNELNIFLSKQGMEIINKLDSRPNEISLFDESYKELRQLLINNFESGNIWSTNTSLNEDDNIYNRLNLSRCELKNGKIL